MIPDFMVVIELTEWGDNDWEGEVTTNGIHMVEEGSIEEVMDGLKEQLEHEYGVEE